MTNEKIRKRRKGTDRHAGTGVWEGDREKELREWEMNDLNVC